LLCKLLCEEAYGCYAGAPTNEESIGYHGRERLSVRALNPDFIRNTTSEGPNFLYDEEEAVFLKKCYREGFFTYSL